MTAATAKPDIPGDRVGSSPVKVVPCPDFDLAPLEKFPPDVFLPDDKLHAFILSLALAYNDLKDIQWMIEQLQKCPQDLGAPSPELGQWTGMKIFTNRATFAILNEILIAIRKHKKLLLRDEMVACVQALPNKAKIAWSALVAAANGRSSDEIQTFLVKVRSNVVSHYYQPKQLLRAYREYFFNRTPDEFNRFAFASLGSRMEETRFYFVDAPPAWYYQRMLDDGKLFARSGKYVHHVNNALRWIVDGFLRRRVAELRKKAR